LRLNKIEIGQFLNTKNKVGMRKNTLINMIVATIVGIAVPILSNIAPVRTVKATVVTMIGKRVGNSFFMSISLPSLVRKILSLIKVVFEKKNIANGTNIKVSQNTTEAMIGKSLIAAVENPALIPNQKTKFQNLSLLILSEKTLLSKLGWFLQNVAKSSMALSYNYWFQIYSIIISKYYRLSKQIKVLILVISLSLCGNNVFAADGKVNGQIEQLIKNTEQQYSIPSGLLVAIAKIESGMNAYALNVNGKSVLASNSREASSLIASARKVGISNIDVGIMQLNYRWHASGFASMQEMLNPQKNIEYAALFLVRLKKQHGTWHKALRYYHSAKPEHHRKYSRKVVLCWLNEQSGKI